MEDYYQILGVDKTSSADEIKSSYRKLAKQHHPDTGGDPERFKKISEAYSILSDPEKRAEYDNPIRHEFDPFNSGMHWNFNNVDEFFKVFTGAGGFHHSQYSPPKNKNLKMILEIDIESLISTQTRTVNLSTGRNNKTLQVTIPAGINDGAMLRYRGYGQDILTQAPPGDLIIEIKVKNSNRFSRVGNNLLSAIRVDCLDAITGAEMPFKTVYGNDIRVKIPKGTQNGTKLRIPNQGLPDTNGKKGDQLLEIITTIPTDLNDEQIESIRKIKQSM